MLPIRVLAIASALTFVLAWATPASAEDEKTIDNCKVVKVDGVKLTLTSPNGDEHTAPVASDAKVTVDGKDVKLADLKSGTKIKITARKGDGGISIVKIEGSTK